MEKTRKRKGLMALILAFVMVVTGFTTGWVKDASYAETNGDGSVTATISVQMGGGFYHVPEELTVTPGYAATIDSSYKNAAPATGKVSVLDMLCKMHVDEFGDDFKKDPTTYLAVSDAGFVTKMFGMDATKTGFAINDRCPNDGVNGAYGYTGYSAAQAEVQNDDKVGFFFYQDTTYYGDKWSWFENGGSAVTQLELKEDEEATLNLRGYSYMSYGCSPHLDAMIENIKSAQIVMIDENGTFTDIDGVKTDESGNITLSFESAGTYYIGAYDASGFNTPVVSPYLKVVVAAKEPGNLAGLSFASSLFASGLQYTVSPAFSPDNRSYIVTVPDSQSGCAIKATLSAAAEGETITAEYTDTSGTAQSVTLGSGNIKLLPNMYTNGGNGNECTIKVGTQEYKVKFVRSRSLSALSVTNGDKVVGLDKAFAANQYEYTAKVLSDVDSLTFNATPIGSDYQITYNGATSNTVSLNPTGDTIVKIKVTAIDGTSQEYTVVVKKFEPAKINIIVNNGNITDSNIEVRDQLGNMIAPDANGAYNAIPGEQITYTVAKKGYTGASATIAAENKTINVALLKTGHDTYPDVGSEWFGARNSAVNMAIVDTYTPIDGNKTRLKWSKDFGTKYGSMAGQQIIVDNCIVTTAGTSIYKVDKNTGEIVAQGTMVGKKGQNIVSPTYAEGMIFVSMDNGIVQAFNAKTLESVWVYTDPLGGQGITPITYDDGCIYLGFWVSETKNANFVAIDVADEDTSRGDEAKVSLWTKSHQGGFYWAGALVVGDYVIVGSDNGAADATLNAEGSVYVFNKVTGEVISSEKAIGDIRTAVVYDAATGNVYFATKAGYLYKMAFDKNNGHLSNIQSKSYTDLGQQATATPIVYDGMVYFTLGRQNSPGTFIAVDANTLEVKDTVPTRGYTQGAFLMSKAYEDKGHLYFYITYNAKPGGIQMVDVDLNARGSFMEISDIYDAAGFEQYCIGSVICDSEGTLYYNNDSGNILAVQNADAIATLISDLESTTIQNLAATRLGKNVTLTWTKEGKTATLDYEIARSSDDGQTFTVLGDTSEQTFVDSNAEDKENYVYRVRGVKTIDGDKYYTQAQTVKVNGSTNPSNNTQIGTNGGSIADGTRTGDNTRLTLWIVLLIVAVITAGGFAAYRRKNK